METLKSIGIILARGGSKGLHRKNLQLLGGVPLVGRVIKHALESQKLTTIIVSTDDEEIADTSRQFGAKVPFLRPRALAQDLTTTEESLQHALIEYERISGITYDIGVFITATDIFRKVEWIDQAIETLEADQDLESVFVGTRTHKNFWSKNEDGSFKRLQPWMANYSSRQIRRPIYREDTGLACASRASLWRAGRRLGDKVSIIENDDEFSFIDIHTEQDLNLAEAALKIRRLYGEH